jgi:hypothetical protein
MGGGASSAGGLKRDQKDIVNLMMPVYFDDSAITDEECRLAGECWGMILNEKSVFFTEVLRKTPDFKYTQCITYFFDLFYQRLFLVHPMARSLFKRGIKSQGKFLVRLITLALSEIRDDVKWNKSFTKLAEMHNEIGVKAIECKSCLCSSQERGTCSYKNLLHHVHRWSGWRNIVLFSS